MMKKILFQGDSITDCGRDRKIPTSLANRYPRLVAASLGTDRPGEYEFINRGISGNRIVDLYARIKADFINIAPDYASVYDGINDVWHEVVVQNGVDTPKFEKIYTMYLEEIFAALPDIKIMLIAPYVLNCPSTCDCEEMPNRWSLFRTGTDEKIDAVKRVGKKFSLPVIELQPAFDEACKKAPPAYWTADGVHPTACGHEIIKRLWLETFGKIR